MIPPTIRRNLAGLRLRERLLAFVWGAACWLAVASVLLVICASIDWFIDRGRDTPWNVRLGLFAVQIIAAAIGAFVFLVWPQVRRLSDTMLALWVEDKLSVFDHRLISAVQFNQPGARLDGMSRELVAVVTREAEREAGRIGFAQVADHGRLKWSGIVLAPILLIAAVPFLIWPTTALALLRRQALLPVEIPHSVVLESIAPEFWPIGETIPIRYRVRGLISEGLVGQLVVAAESQASDEYELRFLKWDGEDAIFFADVPGSSVDIVYSARMRDGRTKLPSEMKLVPRPVVIDNLAWVRLPAYCGLRPLLDGEFLTTDERRYEVPQGRGDVVGIPGSGVRVQVTTQKPIKTAWLQFVGVENPALEKIAPPKTDDDNPPIEKPLGEPRAMKVDADGRSAELSFDLAEGLNGYRMIVIDEHDFKNTPEPRRSLRVVPEDPPQVTLLRDTFGFGADFDVEGLPVLLGGRIRVPYVCYHPYGLWKADLLHRLVKKNESGESPEKEEEWSRLGLPEVNPDFLAGPFDPKTGMFVNTDAIEGSVPFHAVPSSKPQTEMGRKLGGGRYLLATNGLLNARQEKLVLKSGDMIEYCVEVYAADRTPTESTPRTRSETRVSTVMNLTEFEAWRLAISREDEGVKRLEKKQKGVFDR